MHTGIGNGPHPSCRISTVHHTTQMNILETITAIDSAYEPDPTGGIYAIGTTADGRTVDLWIYNEGDGPLIEPGASFLPYGGIYYNPWPLISITAD